MVCLAGSMIVLAACGSSSAAGSTATTASNSAKSGPPMQLTVGDYEGAINDVPDLVAQDQGFFAANNLQVSMIGMPNGPAQAAAVANGSLDVESNTPDNIMLTMSKGEGEVSLVNYISGDFYQIIVQKNWSTPNLNKPFPAPIRDLKGARIGVIAAGGSEQLVTQMLLGEAGVPASSVTFLTTGPAASSVAAWNADRVDAMVVVAPETQLLAANSKQIFNVQTAKYFNFDLWPGQLRAALRSNVEKNPKAYEAYVTGFARAIQFIKNKKNLPTVVSDMAKAINLPRPTLQAMVEAQIPFMSPQITCAGVTAVGNYLVKNNLVTSRNTLPSCSQFVWSKASTLW